MAEEGETGTESESAPVAAAVEPLAGGVTLDADLKIEVDLLTLASSRSVLVKLAETIGTLKPSVVILGDENLLTALRAFDVYRDRIKRLREELASVLKRPDAAKGQTESVVVELAAAASVVNGVASLLSYFRAETTYSGRKVELGESALHPMLAGALLRKSIPVVLPGLLSTPASPSASQKYSVMKILDELCRQRDAVRAKYPENPPQDVTALLSATDAAIEAAIKVDAETGSSSMTQLLQGSDLRSLIADQEKPVFVLLKAISAGGHYRTRKHLFTTLFTGDKLSYSGGVAIGYFVFDLKTSVLLASDVVTRIKEETASHRGLQDIIG